MTPRRVTIKEIARSSGVSVGTVSDIVNGKRAHLYSVATRQRVDETIARLGYVPLRAAQMMRSGESKTVGLVVTHDFTNPFFARLAIWTKMALEAAGWEVLIALALADAKDSNGVARNIVAHDVRGVLIGPIYPYETAVMEAFTQLRSLAIPVVAFGYGLQPSGDDVILIDERKSGHLAVQHLRTLGHRQIGFFASPDAWNQLHLPSFAAGVAEELTAHQQVMPEWFYRGTDDGKLDTFHPQAIAYLQRWKAAEPAYRPTVVICKNDQAAVAMIRAARDLDIDLPHDLSIMGYDNLDEAAYTIPRLTTIESHLLGIVSTATRRLLCRLEGGELSPDKSRAQVQPRLVQRESVRPIRPTKDATRYRADGPPNRVNGDT